jgi:hypothetical protein
VADERMQRRIDLLRALMSEHYTDIGPILFATLICDGCGLSMTATGPDVEHIARHFEDWEIGEHGEGQDFCPGCAASTVRTR